MPESNTATAAPSRLFWIVLASGLLLHAALGLDAARRWTPTHDEYWHLPYGLYYWQTGDLAADPINPPLIRLWAALPLLCSDVRLGPFAESPQPYPMGDALLTAAGAHYRGLFFAGRAMILLVGLAGATAIALLARSWFGERAGIVAVVLWCGCPTLLAQSVVVTHDLGLAAATVAMLAVFHRWRERPTWFRTVIVGVVLGLAQMTKLTAVLLFPVCAGWWLLLPTSTRDWKREALQAAVAIVASWVVLCAGYRFDGVGQIEIDAKNAGANIAWTALPKPYRHAWIRLRGDLKSRHPIFLNGEWQEGGYPQYYLWAFLYKIPLGTLLTTCLATGWVLRRQPSPVDRRRSLALVFAVLVFVVPASLSSNQIGLRYVLPAYPLLILFASQAAGWWNWYATPRMASLTLIAVVLVPAALRYHPHHLAFFNEVAGGPVNGRKHLVDSNIDWGQDLYDLAEALKEIHEPVSIAYFGSVPPHTVGLDGAPPPQFSPEPGWHAVSVNFVEGRPHTLRLPDGRFDIRGLDAYGYFRFFKPKQRIGYSIDVYHLSPEDVAGFLQARAENQ